MSRNLSINKIAPYLTSSFVQGVDKPDAASSFSPYMVHAKDQNSKNKGDGQGREKKTNSENREDQDREYSYPEIFTLTALPVFSELFALSQGEEDFKLMFIVKKLRAERGVSDISEVKSSTQKGIHTYLNGSYCFSASKGECFTGKM